MAEPHSTPLTTEDTKEHEGNQNHKLVAQTLESSQHEKNLTGNNTEITEAHRRKSKIKVLVNYKLEIIN